MAKVVDLEPQIKAVLRLTRAVQAGVVHQTVNAPPRAPSLSHLIIDPPKSFADAVGEVSHGHEAREVELFYQQVPFCFFKPLKPPTFTFFFA